MAASAWRILGVVTAFAEVMGVREACSRLEPPAAGTVAITGVDPVFSTRFKIAETCGAVLAGVGVAVSDIWELKTGRPQKVSISVRHAAAALRSSVYLQRPGADGVFEPVVNKHHQAMIAITQPWTAKDGRWVLPAFRVTEPAGADVETAGLRAQSAVGRQRRGQVGRARSRGGNRRSGRMRRHGPFQRGVAC